METFPSAEQRRGAHRRVGTVATIAFLALLLLGATHGPAQADPATTPAATPQSEPSQQVEPGDGGPRRDHDGFRGGDGDGGGGGRGFGGGDGDGGGSAPAPSAPAPAAPSGSNSST